MKRSTLLALATTAYLAVGAYTPTAHAVVPYTLIANANYSVLNTDVRLVPSVALTANRTITLPSAGATQVGTTGSPASGPGGATSLEIVDVFGNVGGANSCLVISAQSGETINGSTSSITFCSTYGRVVLIPLSGNAWLAQTYGPGQVEGTATNDNAQAGYIGEFISSGFCPGTTNTSTVTFASGTPMVVTWTSHGMTGACPLRITAQTTLPAGITNSTTTYWVVPSSITTNTFTLAASVANALGATAISSSTTGTGAQTGTSGQVGTTATTANVTGVTLSPGDWDCRATIAHVFNNTTNVTLYSGAISASSATLGTQGNELQTDIASVAGTITSNLGSDVKIGPGRISLSAATNYYLVYEDTFSAGIDNPFGELSCRRVR